jgi:hypothetical protein
MPPGLLIITGGHLIHFVDPTVSILLMMIWSGVEPRNLSWCKCLGPPQWGCRPYVSIARCGLMPEKYMRQELAQKWPWSGPRTLSRAGPRYAGGRRLQCGFASPLALQTDHTNSVRQEVVECCCSLWTLPVCYRHHHTNLTQGTNSSVTCGHLTFHC